MERKILMSNKLYEQSAGVAVQINTVAHVFSRLDISGDPDIVSEAVLGELVGRPFAVVGVLRDLEPRGATVALPAGTA